MFATIAIFAALFWTTGAFINGPGGYTALGLLRNAALLDVSIDGVMWSLQLELIAIPLIFVLYLGWRQWGAVALAAPFFILAVLSFSGPWNRAVGGVELGQIHAFVLGMAAFLVAPRLIERCSPRIATIGFAGAAAFFLASRPVLGPASHWSALAEAFYGAIVVSVLAFGRTGPLGAIFDHSLIRFFGRISYSFYLLHPLTLLITWKAQSVIGAAMALGVPPVVVAPFLFVASVASVTPLAYAMYLLVERPGVAAGRKLQNGVWRGALVQGSTPASFRPHAAGNR